MATAVDRDDTGESDKDLASVRLVPAAFDGHSEGSSLAQHIGENTYPLCHELCALSHLKRKELDYCEFQP